MPLAAIPDEDVKDFDPEDQMLDGCLCGTVGCIAGWACELWPDEDRPMCRVYGKPPNQFTRLCYMTGRAGAHEPGDLLKGDRKHVYQSRAAAGRPRTTPAAARPRPANWRCRAGCRSRVNRFASESGSARYAWTRKGRVQLPPPEGGGQGAPAADSARVPQEVGESLAVLGTVRGPVRGSPLPAS